jgi:glycosyltransferase involved in cell wall biosynthesis
MSIEQQRCCNREYRVELKHVIDNSKAPQLHCLLLFGSIYGSQGGMERFNANLMLAVSQSGLVSDCTVLTLNDRMVDTEFLADSASVLCCGSGPRWWQKLKFVFLAVWCCTFRQVDVLICGHMGFLRICRILKQLVGTPHLLIAYGVESWRLTSPIARRTISEARLVLAISRYTQRQLLAFAPSAKVELLSCTVDTEMFRPGTKPVYLLERHHVGARQPVILTVARMCAAEGYKGHDVVLKSLPRVLACFSNAMYLIVGSGDDQLRLQALARALEVADHVIFAGRVPDHELPDYYRLCDLFVMPSFGEGFGIAFLEALATGKPVIGGNRDGSVDPLLDGRAGLLVCPTDEKEVASAILSILERKVDPRLIDSSYLRAMVYEHFSFQRFRERVCDILNSQLAAPGVTEKKATYT